MEIIRVGSLEPERAIQDSVLVYSGGVCPCISTLGSGKSCGGTQQIKVLVNGSKSNSTDGQYNRQHI